MYGMKHDCATNSYHYVTKIEATRRNMTKHFTPQFIKWGIESTACIDVKANEKKISQAVRFSHQRHWFIEIYGDNTVTMYSTFHGKWGRRSGVAKNDRHAVI